MFKSKKITKFLSPGRRVHLVGIGGVSMRPLGLVLKGMGMEVTGSDMNSSVSTDELIAQGIPVAIGHRAENIEGAECIIRTAAAHNDNPEIAAARAAGIPVFERAQAWGEIMKSYKNAICISGTHGKTTTTSMMTHILMEANLDPTVMIGGYLPLLHASHRVGHGDTILLESCEYCDSFLNFFPTLAVVLNVESDTVLIAFAASNKCEITIGVFKSSHIASSQRSRKPATSTVVSLPAWSFCRRSYASIKRAKPFSDATNASDEKSTVER